MPVTFPSAAVLLRSLGLVAVSFSLLGCRCAGRAGPPAGPTPPGAEPGGDRPALIISPRHEGSSPRALVIVLHGYGDNAASFVSALGYSELAAREGFILVAPEGTRDPQGRRYWNATAACCNFFGGRVDDVAYLRRLIAEVRGRYHVDRRRVHLIGLSNGGFMAFRLACEAASEVASLISIAGAAELDPTRCAPASPVSVLQIHGDADSVVRYAGGRDLLGWGGAPYPGAVGSIERWGTYDRCSARRLREPVDLDLDEDLPGAETVVERLTGCPAGVDVGLWTIRGGLHVPRFSRRFVEASWSWLRSHPKP